MGKYKPKTTVTAVSVDDYIADIDLEGLQQIVRRSLVELRKQWPVTDT